jgi:[ribosomal protein S18]-alanine N-acetyltransferase
LPIRTAIAADIRVMLAVERACPTAGHFSEAQYRELIEQSAQVETRGQWRLALVIEENPEANSQIAGFLIGRILDNEWEIENVVIAAASQKRGFGSALVNEFLNRARHNGASRVYLEVRESNSAARRLYEKCKFVETGRRNHYYCNPVENAILYSLGLT